MATISKARNGKWRAQVHRRNTQTFKIFQRKGDAEARSRDMERRLDLGQSLSGPGPKGLRTVADLIDIHIADMHEVGKPLRRSKAYSLELLQTMLGDQKVDDMPRQSLIDFGRERCAEGAGPTTVGMDISYLKTILTHAAAVHGVALSTDEVDLARVAPSRLGIVGRSNERDRRPTENEIERLLAYFDDWERLTMPMSRIVKFAIATAMRQSEIMRVEWADLDTRRKLIKVRDRKDPRQKDGNHQMVPLVDLTGYDAMQLVEEQRHTTGNQRQLFPFNPRTVGTAFRRACRALNIEDLRFHDLRHEGTSRLFEVGLSIERVALVTGHKDWKMLRRYTHLKPDILFSQH